MTTPELKEHIAETQKLTDELIYDIGRHAQKVDDLESDMHTAFCGGELVGDVCVKCDMDFSPERTGARWQI